MHRNAVPCSKKFVIHFFLRHPRKCFNKTFLFLTNWIAVFLTSFIITTFSFCGGDCCYVTLDFSHWLIWHNVTFKRFASQGFVKWPRFSRDKIFFHTIWHHLWQTQIKNTRSQTEKVHSKYEQLDMLNASPLDSLLFCHSLV